MNGVNKKNKKSLWIFTIIYLIGVFAFTFLILQYPHFYSQQEIVRVEKIKEEITTILTNSELSDSEKNEYFAKMNEKNPQELLIVNSGEIVYTSIPVTTVLGYEEYLNTESMSYSDFYRVSDKVYVWLSVYTLSPQHYFESILMNVGILVGLLFSIIIFVVLGIYGQIVYPLRNLRKMIFNLKKFNLSGVNEDVNNNVLNRALSDFSFDLQDKMEGLGSKYTDLERELQAKQELMTHKTNLIGSLVHDFKTPLNIMQLYIKQMMNNEEDSEKIELLLKINTNKEKLQKNINEVLQVMLRDEDHLSKKFKDIETISEIKAILKIFRPIFVENNIHIEIDMVQSLFLRMDEIDFKQIIHNVLSNVSQYTTLDGLFELSVYSDGNDFILEAYNDADTTNIDFESVFNLFYHIEAANTSNTFASGVGMYTIKHMVEQYGGNVEFIKCRAGAMLVMKIPM